MKAIHTSALDLNLLRVLAAVIEEGSTRRAAVRLAITQSAVSHALRRLREQVGEPLAVATPRGMVATPKARQMVESLRRMEQELESTLSPMRFDPSKAQRTFDIEVPDASAALLLPGLARHLAQHAPGVEVRVRAPRPETLAALESGALDLALGLYAEVPAAFRTQLLFRDEFACVMRAAHPARREGARLTLAQYLRLEHLVISQGSSPSTLVDDALARQGHRRRILMRVPYFLVAPLIIADSELVLTTPIRVIQAYSSHLGLHLEPAPTALATISVRQVWHERSHQDEGHRWLRQLVASLCR